MAATTAAAVLALAASRVSSGREACSRSNPACCAAHMASSQRLGVPRRAAAAFHRACSSGSSSWDGGSGSSGCRRRHLAARAASEAEALQQVGVLVPDRQGYRTFQLEGAEFLISETPDGKLDLRDVYVTRDVAMEQPRYQRVESQGLDLQPQAYHDVPWYTEYGGDAINEIPGKQWLWRVYLVPVVSQEPFQLGFDGIWVVDGKSASLQLCEVHRLAPPDTPLRDLRLRIRDDVVTLDTVQSLPVWEHAVQARINGFPALSLLEQQRLAEYLSALEMARQEGTIDETEFETAYDVHWLAGMRTGSEGVQSLGGMWEADEEAPAVDDAFPNNPEEDIMGGWDQEMFADLMPQYDDDEEADEIDLEDFDSPAADY